MGDDFRHLITAAVLAATLLANALLGDVCGPGERPHEAIQRRIIEVLARLR